MENLENRHWTDGLLRVDHRSMPLTFADVLAARETVRRHLPPTPMWSYPVLDAAVGATVLVKHENVQPVGAFKVRGGLTLLASMSAAERKRGTVTYSTGNHAQSLAYASALHGAPCTVVMPAAANPAKAEAVRGWGGEVILAGDDLEGAQRHAEEHAARIGARLVSPGDTPELLAGVGTLYLEILEAQPELEAIVVPIGSGTGASAAAVVAATLAPRCRVIGVQSTESPAAHDSWRSGVLERRPNRTRVDGLATGRGYELPQQILRERLADFLLVTDEQIGTAQRLLATAAHTLAEGAGAAGLAALLSRPDLFAGKRVAVVCTGGNADATELAALATT
jgi:threonine dehydratase